MTFGSQLISIDFNFHQGNAITTRVAFIVEYVGIKALRHECVVYTRP